MQCKVEDFILSSRALSSPCLDLSKKAISDLPEEMVGCEHLECLYLEGNQLTSLPASLFSSCPNLRWLDLRNNLLTHLPPSIHILRGLKTLLLQGNRLTSLPPELGELRQLAGLSLASNPLSSPPPSVVQRGTSSVLHYLREQLARRERERGCERGREGERREGDEGEGSFKSGDEYTVTPPQQMINKATMMSEVDLREKTVGSDQVLPFVLQPHLKQAHIHPHPSPSSSSHSHQATHGRSGLRGGQKMKWVKERGMERGTREPQQQRGRLGERLGGKGVHVQPLTSAEKLHANIVIQKQRSKERLEQWQAEAREGHLRPSPGLPQTADTAPFATERQHLTAHPQKPAETSDEHSLHSRLRSSHDCDEVVCVRVQQYNKTLQDQRRQAGLIVAPSSELLQAERNLAEALAQRDQMEDRKIREYRLTAFTADPNLL